MTQHVQTKREIQETLEAAGVHPQRRFGQHFLIDGNLMRRLVESAELTPDDCIIEVGPGTGGLTDLLAARAARVVAVEIDRTFFDLLTDRFRENENVILLFGDVLNGKHHLMPALVDEIRAGGASPRTIAPAGASPAAPGIFRTPGASPGPADVLLAQNITPRSIKLVANLPYQVATPLVMNLLVDFPQVTRLCFTVQAEVGERITAARGGKDFGPLSILCQSLCTIATIARIGAQCFWPAPHVDSVMLRLDVRERPIVSREQLPGFAALVRGAFDHRRKQLRAALTHAGINPAAASPDFDLSRRPEDLAIDEWHALFLALRGGL